MRYLIDIVAAKKLFEQRDFKGAHYEQGKHLDIKDIAIKVRKHLKDAISSGDLPSQMKCSVKISRYSGGRSLDVTITYLPHDFKFLSDGYASWKKQFPSSNDYQRFSADMMKSEEHKNLIKKVDEIRNYYNYDRSDVMSDYFEVNYYGSTDIDYDLQQSLKQKDIDEADDNYWADTEADRFQ